MFSIQSYKSVRRLSPLDLMVSVTTTQLCYCRSDLACSLLISGLNHPSRYSVASDIPSVFSFFLQRKLLSTPVSQMPSRIWHLPSIWGFTWPLLVDLLSRVSHVLLFSWLTPSFQWKTIAGRF